MSTSELSAQDLGSAQRRPLLSLRQAAICLLTDKLPDLEADKLDNLLEKPPEEMGDLAFPCFALAKLFRKAPVQIATDLKTELEQGLAALPVEKRLFSSITQAGPYLNFHFNTALLASMLRETALTLGQDFGNLEPTETRVIIEHTSANPTGPFHIGRARNPIIGDTMARILKCCGHQVSTEYYVNDMGRQAMVLKWGVDHLGPENAESYLQELNAELEEGEDSGEATVLNEIPKKVDYRYSVLYRMANRRMEEDPTIKAEIEDNMLRLEQGERSIGESSKAICSTVLEGLTQSLEDLNIHLDRFSFESKYVFNGSVHNVIENLKKSPLIIKEEGAFGLDLEGITHGRSNKFFFTRKGGSSLYTTRDLAYHLDKLGRCDMAINVLGEDHKLQAIMLRTALEELAKLEGVTPKLPESMFYSFVTLKDGKMSTREGRVVYFDDLITEGVHRAREELRQRRPELPEEEILKLGETIGKGAVRFNIIKVQPEKHMRFSWEDALSFEGESAPFVMYSTVRAGSILAKGNFNVSFLQEPCEYSHEMEHRLIKQLASFPEIVAEAGEKRAPHLIAAYALKTAAAFNAFYRDCKVVGSGEEEKGRLVLVYLSALVLRKALGLLGIDIPGKM